MLKMPVRGPGDWMATVAAAWSAVTTPLFLFVPLGQSCAGSGLPACSNPSIAAVSPPAATAVFLIVALAFGLLPFGLRRRRAWLRAWALFPLLAFFGTFGADVWILPAGVLAFIASFLPFPADRGTSLG